MVETVYDLCQPSMFTTMFPSKPGLSFLFSFGNLSLYDRTYESDQNPERSQPKRFPHRKALGKTCNVTAPDGFKRMPSAFCFARAVGGPHVHEFARIVRPQFTSCFLFEKD